jgi:glycosyltransferase involved in cell wall biosynthesis
VTVDPLVSCIMPTRDRRAFVPAALEYFRRQDYSNRELVIVDDGRDSVADLIPSDPVFLYLRSAPASVGEKRNTAVRAARGTYIAHWDDDDWYGAGRLSAQVRMVREDACDVSALSMRHVLCLARMEFWRCEPAYHAWLHYRDLCCGTIVYPRSLWERCGPYPSMNVAEDMYFLRRAEAAGARLRRLDDESHFVCVRHGRNTWRIARDWTTNPAGWTAIPPPAFLSEDDYGRYTRLAGKRSSPGSTAVA